MTNQQAQKLLQKAQRELETKEIESIKKNYPKGLPVGSPMWYAWKDKLL